MCGIFVKLETEPLNEGTLRSCLDGIRSMAHRGPDGEGGVLIGGDGPQVLRLKETPADVECDIEPEEYKGGARIFLGHRRLSIFDLSDKGHQPMRDAYGNWIIHNGEIFNFPEIREELSKKGHAFQTGTDTEVILAAYREWGEECLNRFNGMWSFAIWDARKGGLFVANDRFGIKPLYTAERNGQFLIASEVKAFTHFPELKGEIDPEVVGDFVHEAHLDHDERSFFQGVDRFPPGHWAFIVPGEGWKAHPYWEASSEERYKDPEEAVEAFRSLFEDAVSLRMRSDVPYGVSLSGGIDSGGIAYKVVHLLKSKGKGKKVHAFGAVFPGMEGDESEHIHRIVEDLGLPGHYTEPMKEFSVTDLKRMIWHQDAPLPGTSFYAQWCVMRKAYKAGFKVLLGGQGADELFAGYHHHFYKYARGLLLGGRLRRYFDEVKRYAGLKGKDKKEVHRIVLNDIRLLIQLRLGRFSDQPIFRDWAKAGLKTSAKQDFSSLQLPYYLHSDDRTSMAFGVETRLPFMDYRLVRFANALSNDLKVRNGWQKWVVREGVPELPESVRYRKDKKGFTTPQQAWVEKHFDEMVGYLDGLEELGVEVDKDALYKRKGRSSDKDFRLLSLGVWLDLYKGEGAKTIA